MPLLRAQCHHCLREPLLSRMGAVATIREVGQLTQEDGRRGSGGRDTARAKKLRPI